MSMYMKTKTSSFETSYDWYSKAEEIAREYGWDGIVCESDSGICCIPDWSAAGMAKALDQALAEIATIEQDPSLPSRLWDADLELQQEYATRTAGIKLRQDGPTLTELREDMLYGKYRAFRLSFFADEEGRSALRELASLCRTGFVEYS